MPQDNHSDPYEEFAAHYDLFHGTFGEHPPAVEAFFRRLFAEHGVQRVLDCACGTGQHLPLFHSLGCDVAGSDISAAMLARARENLAAIGLKIPLAEVDYRELPDHYGSATAGSDPADRGAPPGAPFDAVACLSSSILHMPDGRETLRALDSMRDVLRPGGILVLTQGTSDRQWADKPRFILATNTPELTRLFVIDYAGRGARYNIVDIWRGGDGGLEGELKVWGMDYPQVLLRDDYARLLGVAGFHGVAFYGDYDREPYDKAASQRLIIVATK